LKRGFLLAIIAICIGSASNSTLAQYGYYYSGKKYGSEAIFNPVNQVIAGGFDMIYITRQDSKLDKLRLPTGYRNVFLSLKEPREAIECCIGWNTFLKTEILFSLKNGQWLPNYSLHLLGGVMEYARLTDYYSFHEFKFPRLWAFATSTFEHLLNEAVETAVWQAHSYAVVSDLYFFNNIGIIAFSFKPIQRFFAEELILRSWLSQTAYSVRDNSIKNIGQYYSIKWKPPFMKNYSLFTHMGAGFLVGAGRTKNEETISIGAGFRTHKVYKYDTDSNLETISTRPAIGFFVDRNNSLLGSFVYTHGSDFHESLKLEIYPGFVKTPFENIKMGFWVNASYDYPAYVGITIGNFPSIAL
jgi:hypothetical protein